MRDPEILHEEITRRLDMIIKNTNKPPTIYSSHEKDEIESIIDKYTGKTIDDIPDSFIDGQTLEIRKLIRFIKSGSLLDNPCDEHTDFVGDACPVCLQELRENLKCCGNCKLYANSYCKVYYGWPKADSVCQSWTFDGLNKTERNDKSK